MANESRRRTDNIAGTLASTLSAASTTMKASALASLEAISSTEHAVIVLDPGRTAGAPEVVYVTAHTASSTSASIQRGREGTSARTHSSTERWVHGPTRQDFPLIVSSTSRPSAPFAGETIYERDTKEFMGYDGAAWSPFSAGGQLAYASASTAQTLTAEADLTGLTSGSLTLPANRRIRITGAIRYDNANVAANDAYLQIIKVAGASSLLQEAACGLAAASARGDNESVVAVAIVTSTAGSVSYKLRGSAGLYNIATVVGVTYPGFILVEDLGPA